jgi:hypothetical protein
MKKLTSLILALAMCFALGAPAFASETGSLDTELVSVLPELQMTLPDSASIILNPYRMTTTQSGTGIDSGDRFQIMNPVFSVVSNTTSKVHVSATVTASVGGNAQFVTTAVPEGTAGHNVHLTLTHQYHEDNNALVPYPDAASNPTNVVTLSDTEQALAWDLPAKGTGSNAKSQRIDMQLGGTCSDSPTSEEGPWTDSDTVSASFVFEVTPVTDFPMITASYQNASTPGPLEFKTTKPADSKSYKVLKYKVGSGSLTNGDSAEPQVTTKWDGSKVTLDGTIVGTGLTVTATKYVNVEVQLQYENSKKAGELHNVTYTVKVLCFPAPQQQNQQQNPNP